MSEVTEKATVSEKVGFRDLAVMAAGAMVAWAVASSVLLGGIEFFVPYIVIYGVVLFLLLREVRAGPVVLVVVSALSIAIGVSFSAGDLAHPESWRGFIVAVTGLAASGTGVVSGLGVLRGWRADLAPRVGASAVAIAVTAVVLALGSAAALENDVAETGDHMVAASGFAFIPSALSASAGTVNIFVENADFFRHTFTIPALRVNVELPADTDRRISFTADPGTYHVLCDIPGHEAMSITLTVEG